MLNFTILLLEEVTGSTFKLASVIAGLEDGFLQLDDSVNTTGGKHSFYDRVMRDSKKGGYGIISLEESFTKSSNVGISKLINKHYKAKPSQFVDRLYSMGINEPLGIALSGEVKPAIRHPKNLPIGLELLCLGCLLVTE